GSDYRKIVNVADGNIVANSHDAITGGQLYENYYNKSEIDTKLINKANVADVYNKTDADAKFATKEYVDNTFVKIEDNKISNNGDITFDVGTTSTDNVVKISTTGITVGSTSTHIDGKGVYVGAHNFEDAKSAMNCDGEIKGAGGKFKVGTDGSVKAADGNFTVDASGKVTAKEVTADNLYTKTEIDGMIGGSSNAIAGINQRLEKTNAKINKVGAGTAALAALHPLEYDPDDKLTFSAGMGNYAGENAAALGAFYRPNEKFMVSLGGTMGNGENMVNLGLSIGLDKPNGFAKMSKRELIQEVNAVKAENNMLVQKVDAVEAELAEMKAMLQAIMAKK
ncbi:MAG: YadA C-terminal domain-containing protein, partial [Phascolarctobacterium sp.]|nr:YadA C-terminal domain-containing protein [Phascolarctobacterium sp.]